MDTHMASHIQITSSQNWRIQMTMKIIRLYSQKRFVQMIKCIFRSCFLLMLFFFAISLSLYLPPPSPKQAAKPPKMANGHNHSHESSHMNMRGAYLHVLSDALGSIIVIISALIVMFFKDWNGSKYVDPALSIFLVALILHSVWPLLRESALILLQTVPTHIQVRLLISLSIYYSM